MLASLPIDAALPDLLADLARRPCAVLVAPPGSGKTTRVPPALLSMGPGQVLVLQPRRVAARLAARRIAEERGGRVGGEIGYRTRFERRVGPKTRLEVLTEGLLLRRLQSDPFLDGVAAVVLDEFHERSLDIDLALALLREVQEDARPDLLLVVMSATLDPAPVAAFLGGEERCSVFEVAGRRFPVEHAFDPRPSKLWLADRVAAAVRQELAAQTEPGHVLVFLPGVGEIEAARRALQSRDRPLPSDVSIHALHGSLSARDQDAALAPDRRRKVVLATNIAETSITLEGVRSVVDTGLAKVPRFDLGTGVERLELQRIPRSSADQRAGRAGRTGPGRCRRLWTEAEDRQLVPAHVPAVRRVALAPVSLQLAAWGADPSTFRWFERPSSDALAGAKTLLTKLGALAETGITSRGRSLASLPLHPRLGTVLLAGAHAGVLASAATAAALLASRDVVRRDLQDETEDDDLALRLRLVALRELRERLPRSVDVGAIDEVRRVRDQLVRAAERLSWDSGAAPSAAHPLVAALLQGFPDRVALRRAGGERFLLASGTGCRLAPHSLARTAELVLALSLGVGPRGGEAMIRLAVPLQPEWLDVEEAKELAFDPDREAVTQRRVRRYGALLLDDRPVDGKADPVAVAHCLERAARKYGAARLLDFDRDANELLGRIATIRPLVPELDLPDPGDPEALLPALCAGRRSFGQLRKASVMDAVRSTLTWKQRAALDELAPERIRVPSGSKIRLRYDPQGVEPPVLPARIQQLFGMSATPRIARGRLGVLVHLLAPNNRPAQVTSDLASFWANTYPAVRKDLRGRYPKHSWPEDPTTATAEDRPRRRR